jgi:hypothetical protein
MYAASIHNGCTFLNYETRFPVDLLIIYNNHTNNFVTRSHFLQAYRISFGQEISHFMGDDGSWQRSQQSSVRTNHKPVKCSSFCSTKFIFKVHFDVILLVRLSLLQVFWFEFAQIKSSWAISRANYLKITNVWEPSLPIIRADDVSRNASFRLKSANILHCPHFLSISSH